MSAFAVAGSWVTTEGGARVARLAKHVEAGTIFAAELFCDWQIKPVRNGQSARAFLGPDGQPWAGTFPAPSGVGFVARIHVEGAGWVPENRN